MKVTHCSKIQKHFTAAALLIVKLITLSKQQFMGKKS